MLTTIQDKIQASAIPVAVAADMTARIIGNIAGNDIATSINGVVQTREAIGMLVIQRIMQGLNKKLKATPVAINQGQ